MTLSRFGWLLVALSLALVFASACGDDDDDDSNDDDSGDDDDDADASDLIDEGKMWLQAGEPDRARLAFRRAVQIEPDNSDGRYGLMLSSDLHLWSLVVLFGTFLIDQDDGFDTGDDVKASDDNRELLRQIVGVLANQIFDPAAVDIQESARWLIAHDDPTFTLADIPVDWQYSEVATLGSEFDAGERAGSQAWSRVFDGAGKALYAIKIDTSLDYLFNYDNLLDLDGSVIEILSSIVHFLDLMLTDPGFPEFLRIDPDELDRFRETRYDLGLGLYGLAAMLNEIHAETDPQEDDVIAYFDVNGNARYDDGEPLVFPGVGVLDDADMALIDALQFALFKVGAALLDRTELDVDPAADNPLDLSVFNPLLRALDAGFKIPEGITIDLAGFYETVQPDTVRDFIIKLVDLLGAILPDPPDAG